MMLIPPDAIEKPTSPRGPGGTRTLICVTTRGGIASDAENPADFAVPAGIVTVKSLISTAISTSHRRSRRNRSSSRPQPRRPV